ETTYRAPRTRAPPPVRHIHRPAPGSRAVGTTTAPLQGASIVVNPDSPLNPDTHYKLTLGSGITDMAGNHFAGPESIQFTTAPYDTSGVQTAPLLIGLHPGMPCALSGGDLDRKSTRLNSSH